MGELQKLKDRHIVIAQMLSVGMTQKEIAAHFGITEAGIRYARNSPLFQQRLGELQIENDKEATDFAGRIRVCKELAIERIEENLGECASIDKGLQSKCAWDILDRGPTGHKVPDKVIEQNTNIQVNNIVEMSDAELELKSLEAAQKVLASGEQNKTLIPDAEIVDAG